MFLKLSLLVFVQLFLLAACFAQSDSKLVADKNTLCLNEMFSLSVSISNSKEKNIGSFPEIPEFLKRRTVYEKKGGQYRIIQYYQPTKTGSFTMPAAGIYVNGKVLYADAKNILVKQSCSSDSPDFDEVTAPYEDVKEDALFRLESSKSSVYPGEIFEITATFLIARDNKAEMNFIDFNTQMKELAGALRTQDFWVESAGFPEHAALDSVTINGKKYNRYTFFNQKVSVLKEGKVKIAPFSWKMIKYKVSKNKNFIDRKDTLISLKSAPLNIGVKSLPEHPMKDKVPVGVFKISEKLESSKIETGEKTVLNVTIKGKEAWPNSNFPSINQNKNLEFYVGEINTKKVVNEWEKNFSFYIIPSRKGNFRLGDYLYWVSFNTETGLYDTLKPASVLRVKDESFTFREHAAAYQNDQFYQQLEKEIRQREQYNYWEYIKYFGNIFIILLAVGTLALIIRR